jgi:hypothetical protein
MSSDGLDQILGICIIIGNDDQLGRDMETILPFSTIVRLRGESKRDTSEWSFMGFASEEEFLSVKHQVNLIVTLPCSDMRVDNRREHVESLLEHAGAMDVIVLLNASNHEDDLMLMQSVPSVKWLEARVIGWRRLPVDWRFRG